MEFGERCRQLRIQKGLTQEAASNLAGITKGHLQQIERRESGNPTMKLMIQMAEAYGVSLDYLAGREKEAIPHSAILEIAEERACRQKMEKLNAELREENQRLTGQMEEMKKQMTLKRDELAVAKLHESKRGSREERLLAALIHARNAEQANSEYIRKVIQEMGGSKR